MSIPSDKISKILQAEEASFSELVHTAGLDPDKICRYANFENFDLTNSNLAGFDFTAARLSGAQFTGSRIMGAVFDAPQRGLPELREAEDYKDAANAWLKKAENRERPTTVSGEWLFVWPDGKVPDWVDEFGTDSYGKWASFTVNGVTQVLRYCPPGRFLMGSSEEDMVQFSKERPRQMITFSNGFWLMDTTVSRPLRTALYGHQPDDSQWRSNLPTTLRLAEVVKIIRMLNSLIPELKSRLPSEAEWEYACRAGSVTPFNPAVAKSNMGLTISPTEVVYAERMPDDDQEREQYSSGLVSVKGNGFRPNNWGLWHMHGNVFERCADTWSINHDGADPEGKARRNSTLEYTDENHVVRGGSAISGAAFCRSAYRNGFKNVGSIEYVGLRLASDV